MISAITWKLLLVLVLAALLGLLMGLSGMRLHQARKQRGAGASQKGSLNKLTAERDALLEERTGMSTALEQERQRVRSTLEKCSLLAAQQDTLKVHSGLQTQRVEKLTTQLSVAEEKCIRLQRDFASFKANKLREVRMLKASSDEWVDGEELPVLNKKVQNDHAQTALKSPTQSAIGPVGFGVNELDEDFGEEAEIDMDSTQPIIASELDIPSLAESELPDSVEELEFELTEEEDDGNEFEFELSEQEEPK